VTSRRAPGLIVGRFCLTAGCYPAAGQINLVPARFSRPVTGFAAGPAGRARARNDRRQGYRRQG